MIETLEQARSRDRLGRTIQVLILVKTTPVPSKTYEDTVCVAGLAIWPGPVRWVRLYPIAFRHLATEHQFKKGEIVSVRVSRPSADPRLESLRVDASSIRRVKQTTGWAARLKYLNQVEWTTACALRDGARADANATSLGLVIPKDAQMVTEPHPGWSEEQEASIRLYQQQTTLDLDGDIHRQAPRLEPPAYKAWYQYRCATGECRGHKQSILDWELTLVQRRAAEDGADIPTRMRQQFHDNMFAPDRRPMFVLGNNAKGNKRQSFEVLTVLWPKTSEADHAAQLPEAMF